MTTLSSEAERDRWRDALSTPAQATQDNQAHALDRGAIIDLISPLSLNTADHDIEFAFRVLDAAQAQQSIDAEALIRAVLPGGSSCDPQTVADEIRRYLGQWPGHINDGKGCRWIETSADDIIARVYKDACSKERFEANSRLIQHAPDMIDALKDAHAHIADDQLRTRIGNLIAKATGANHE